VREARAGGKLILLGEHFVVHGAPALALPLSARTVEVGIQAIPGAWEVLPEGRSHLQAMLRHLGHDPEAMRVVVRSTLPVGMGLGSSAALAVALCRALGYGEAAEVNQRAFELERIAHGNPSGIDNTVIAWERPVFMRSRAEPFEILEGLRLPPIWVGLTPAGPPTRVAVAGVAGFREAHRARFEVLLTRARELAFMGRGALDGCDFSGLGRAMTQNHGLLAEVGVSTPPLDRAVAAALKAGAWGAKLTGGGMGGAMVAIAPGDLDLEPALRSAGAVEVIRP
jgi:mevalonate kinase